MELHAETILGFFSVVALLWRISSKITMHQIYVKRLGKTQRFQGKKIAGLRVDVDGHDARFAVVDVRLDRVDPLLSKGDPSPGVAPA